MSRNGDKMEYTKLVMKIAKLLEVEYTKIAEVEANIKDTKLGLEIQEAIAENTIKKLCRELEQELI